jgi:hypothetical protein
MRMNLNSETWFARFAGLMLICGSVMFSYGGVRHPRTAASALGSGPQDYFQSFAHAIHSTADWRFTHSLILAGPLLWVMVSGAYLRAGVWERIARTTLPIFAACWAVTFIFDGFAAPAALDTFSGDDALRQLASNQQVVIRTGLVAWLLLAASMFSASVGLLLRATLLMRMIAALGILIASFSAWAWMSGSFLPGPFVSPYWGYTALATALWFLLLGVRLLIAPLVSETGRDAPVSS